MPNWWELQLGAVRWSPYRIASGSESMVQTQQPFPRLPFARTESRHSAQHTQILLSCFKGIERRETKPKGHYEFQRALEAGNLAYLNGEWL